MSKKNEVAEVIEESRRDSVVHHPGHYTKGNVECIDALRSALGKEGFTDHCLACTIKYAWRWRSKGGLEDLQKARVYLNWAIQEQGGK